ncbi:MAG: TVP38/TMEM64 family protein [Deltaproteobacteria bacterium]|nr:TVP38/TMEM64 family protein [Deltaproteobacteria bacterium]
MSDVDPAADQARRSDSSARRWPAGTRVVLALVLVLTLVAVGKLTGLDRLLDRERVKLLVESAGALGLLAYIAIFSVGQLLSVPGLVFVAAGILIYGRVYGAGASLLGAVVAVTVSFQIVRAVGGQPLGAVQKPFMRRVMAQLDARPIRSIALLRMVFWLAPPVNYALALSRVRLRDFVIGSALGMLVPIGIASCFFDWLFG